MKKIQAQIQVHKLETLLKDTSLEVVFHCNIEAHNHENRAGNNEKRITIMKIYLSIVSGFEASITVIFNRYFKPWKTK